MLVQKAHGLNEYAAGAAGSGYKDVTFDDARPIVGKVYINSENSRKQGVSCSFRCISRCSIGPTKA